MPNDASQHSTLRSTTEYTGPETPLPCDLLLGTDLVYIPRLAKAYARHGEAFFARLLNPLELAYCRGEGAFRVDLFLKRAAARIAVKEALSKALGLGLNGLGWGEGVNWHEIEVVSQPKSPPGLVLTGRALDVSCSLSVHTWRLSFSHDGDYATATVIGLTTNSA